jgi:hypothetical protein
VDWNPWRELRRRPHIAFTLADLPAGVEALYARRRGRAAIAVSRALPRRERAAALAHELVHDELADEIGPAPGATAPPAWDAVVAREEARIDREVARRCVDLDALAAFVDRRVDLDEAVDAADVAECFDVAEWVARAALEQLRDRRRG